jgi:hypothetical protein
MKEHVGVVICLKIESQSPASNNEPPQLTNRMTNKVVIRPRDERSLCDQGAALIAWSGNIRYCRHKFCSLNIKKIQSDLLGCSPHISPP